jgi:PAS domain S-box-containing protein
MNELNRRSMGVPLVVWGAWRRRVNDHHEQHCSDTRRTPEVLAVQGTGEREFASGPQHEGSNSIPSEPTPRFSINLSQQRRDPLRRYGLALALSSLALFLRGVLPFGEGVAPYQLSLAAVVLSAWYGGRGPGWLASLISVTGVWYLFVPPVHSFQVSSDHALGLAFFIGLCVLLTGFGAGRRRVEYALRVNEERFRTLVQFSFDVYWETDARHRFTRQEFSANLKDAPARGSEIGKTRWEVPYVEPDEEAWRQHRATLDAHLPFRDFELARSMPDGGRRYVSVSGVPVFDEAGRFAGYRGVGRHITELKRAAAERQQHVWFLESLDRIHRAMQGTDDLKQMLDRALVEVLEIFQCERAVFGRHAGQTETGSFTLLAKRERPGFALERSPGVEVAADANLSLMSAELKAAGGPVQWVLGDVPPETARVLERLGVQSTLSMPIEPKTELRDHIFVFALRQCTYPRVWTAEEVRLFQEIGWRLGDAMATLSTLRDLRESERKLEAAQRIAHVGWWERDYVTGRISLSDEVRRIYGVQPVDLAQWHARRLDLIHPEDRSRVAAASETAMGGGARYDLEYRVVRPDGTVRVVHSQGDVTRDESGRPVRHFGVMQDITELRQAEDELRARQDMLDIAQKAARAVAFDWHLGARESENRWSPELEAMYGLEPGTFDRTYQGWRKLVHPDDWPSVKSAIERANESGDVDAEYRVIHKGGSVRWLRAKGRMFFDADGRPERMVGFMIDVTDRRHAEAELRATEARFRTFVDHATDGFFLMDHELKVVDVNRQACESLGYSREELVGMHPRHFDASLDEAAIAGVASRAVAEQTITFETRHRRQDGTTFPVEIRVRTFTQAGHLFYLALVRDISERKRAEESLRQSEAYLAEAQRLSHTGSWALDIASGKYVYTSAESDRIYGFDPRVNPPTREAIFERIHPEDRTRWKRNLEKSLREEVDTFDEYRIVLPDGTLRHLHVIRHPVLDDTGKIVRLMGTTIDITERKLAEETLREKEHALQTARTELARVSRLTTLGEMTTSIAHEVSQPIGAMVASAGACARWLAADPPAFAEARATLDNIVADGKRAREVITRIRALTKRQAPRKELLDINYKIAEVLALTEHELRSHDIVLRTQLDKSLPGIAGDRVQLQQVILNLIVNAMEAMSGIDDRSRELTVVSGRDDTNAVVVEVRDSGSGLDAHSAERLFEAFYTTKAEGIGIGLSISRSIVEAHGGQLSASANEPHGAVFRFSLPVAKEAG